tara:strand:+ start:1279 stop:1977 length:699 start_codon:yes stop_codon:yes gene_type:complete
MNNIEQLIYDKLTENTGKHFLDSGGNENRHWQKNQSKTIKDFINEDEQFFSVGFDKDGKADEILRTVSVFHFLAGNGSNLELDELSKEFNKLNELNDELADCEPYGVGVNAWSYLSEFIDENNIHTWNTYNYDSDLSQTLQGANIRLFIDGQYEHYVLIQIHGGCDVRGGYTNAMLFKCEYGIINEYLYEHMDSDDIIQNELEYINQVHDWFKHDKVYKGEKLETIKQQLSN